MNDPAGGPIGSILWTQRMRTDLNLDSQPCDVCTQPTDTHHRYAVGHENPDDGAFRIATVCASCANDMRPDNPPDREPDQP